MTTLTALRDTIQNFDASAFGHIQPMPSKWGKPSFTPYAGVHPRLLFLPGEIPALLKKLETPDCIPAAKEWEKLRFTDFDGRLPPPAHINAPIAEVASGSHNYHGRDLAIIEAKAFAYALMGDEQAGLEAVLAMKNYHATFAMSGRIQDGTRIFSHIILATAEVYDWCYALMDHEDRRQLLAAVQNLWAPQMEIGFPPSGQGAVTGHGGEAQLLRDWLALSIAVYDEYTDAWDFVMGRIENEFVPARNFMYKSGVHNQGSAYGPYRYGFEVIAALMVRPFGKTLFGDGMEATMTTFLHWLRPDSESLRIGDDFNQKFSSYVLTYLTKAAFFASALFHNGVFKGYAKTHLHNFTEFFYENDMITPTQFLIWHDADTPVLELSHLPTVCKNPSPTGAVLIRSGWDCGASMAYMKIGEAYSGNHEHLECGNFQLYEGGILASDSGVYDWYFSEEDVCYNKMTIAHNAMLIEDEGEETHELVIPSGGQRTDGELLHENRTLGTWMTRGTTHFAKLLDLAAQPGEYASISGDLTAAYHPCKCARYIRRMLAVLTGDKAHPLYFFVYDNVQTVKPKQKKIFLLHMEKEPEVSEGMVTVHNGGTLTSHTLLPRQTKTEAIGGAGREFIVCGRQMKMKRQYPLGGTLEAGWGRVEISSQENEFLHAMYTGEGSLPAATLDCGNEAVGALLPGCAAIFAKEEAIRALALSIPSETDVILVGAEAGYWEIRMDGALYAARVIIAGECVLKIHVPAGYMEAMLTAQA